MAVFQEPTQWDHALGNNADVSTLPDNTSATTGVASLQKLFQIINQTPLEAGGVAPEREDINALFKILGDSVYYGMNGGLASYNPAYDYVVGRYVVYNDTLYKCIQANGASSTVVAPDSVSPLGSDYWKDIENQDSTSLIPNQIIQSPVPLTDANLHLLDGALLSGSGAYSAYVTMMGELYNADPTATCWTDEATWQASVTTYGECGKFVFDSVNNTLRLPKLTSFVQATNTASELGDLVEAGVPNITGTLAPVMSSSAGMAQGTGAFVTSTNGSDILAGGVLPVYRANSTFDASRSSSVYGNSNTVQPQAIKYYFYIVVGTVSKTDIQIDIDNVMTDLALKADTDLSNAIPTNAFATAMNSANIRTVVETYVNGTSWYRVYSDGWCEQGGITAAAGAAYETVTLLKPFRDTNYSALCASYITNNNNSTAIGIGQKTTTTCQFTCSGHSYQLIWECRGYIS